MTQRKARLTVTVDQAWVRAGSKAVVAGRAESLSGWVNLAMAERAAKEARLQALTEAVALYEAEFGTISAAELAAQERADRILTSDLKDLVQLAAEAGRDVELVEV